MQEDDRDEVVVQPHWRRRIDPSAVKALFDEEGWWPERSVVDVVSALDRGPAVGAWCGRRLVGVARAVSDGVLRAYLEDVIVAAGSRRRGVGTNLVHALHRELGSVQVVSAFFDPALIDFYARLGYRPTSQVVAHRQSGTWS